MAPPISQPVVRNRAWTLSNMRLGNAPTKGPIAHVVFDTSAVIGSRTNGNVLTIPQPAFPFLAGCLKVNSFAAERRIELDGTPRIPDYPDKQALLRVNVLSLNGPVPMDYLDRALDDTFRDKYRLQSLIGYSCFDRGYEAEALRFVQTLAPDLFVTGNPLLLAGAVVAQIPAVFVPPFPESRDFDALNFHSALMLVFDGDRCIIGPENDVRTDTMGIATAATAEITHREIPHRPGPLHPFFLLMRDVRRLFPKGKNAGIGLGVATARGTSHYARFRHTMNAWRLRLDAQNFTSGTSKVEFLRAVAPTFFFDDTRTHVDAALAAGIGAGLVVADDVTLEAFLADHELTMRHLAPLGVRLSV